MKTFFTDEQIEILEKNPYTYLVSRSMLKFTDDFRDDFWRLYLTDMTIKDIFLTLGYDPQIIGSKRMDGFVYNLRKRNLSQQQREATKSRTCKVKRPPLDVKYTDMKTAEAIRAMEAELTYLRQEVDLLKKLCALEHQLNEEQK